MFNCTEKLKELKARVYAIARSLGLHCTQTKHFKKRGLCVGLDLRSKRGWTLLCDRVQELANGVVVPLLLAA